MSDLPPPPPPGSPVPPPPPSWQTAARPIANAPSATPALILGLIGVLGCGFGTLAGPAAIYFGMKANHEIRDAQGHYGGQGMATAGIVLGAVACLLLVFLLFFWLLVLPASA